MLEAGSSPVRSENKWRTGIVIFPVEHCAASQECPLAHPFLKKQSAWEHRGGFLFLISRDGPVHKERHSWDNCFPGGLFSSTSEFLSFELSFSRWVDRSVTHVAIQSSFFAFRRKCESYPGCYVRAWLFLDWAARDINCYFSLQPGGGYTNPTYCTLHRTLSISSVLNHLGTSLFAP